MNILAIGDIIGKSGCDFIRTKLKAIKLQNNVDFCIANGENAVGVGIDSQTAQNLWLWGVDVITLGNHTWNKRNIINTLDSSHNIIRPANFHPDAPGMGYTEIEMGKCKVAVVNLIGRIFMDPADCPFRTMDNILKRIESKVIFVDFHGEATSEKVAFANYVNGRVTGVFGTHTHVPTADQRVLSKGTGYVTDLGMTGSIDSVIGIKKEQAIYKFVNNMPVRFESDEQSATLNSALFDIDETTGRTISIKRIDIA